MQLTFKDLKQQKFVIEAEPSETVADVKQKISSEKGWDAAQQKLIYSGKILQDANTVESYNIEEKGFIVCMVSKPKAQPPSSTAAKVPSTPAPATSRTPSAPPAPVPAVPQASADAPATPSPAPAASANITSESGNFNDPSALALGSQREAAISNMENRAVEYLLNGIPERAEREPRQATQAAPGPDTTASQAQTSPATGVTSPPGTTSPAPAGQPINLFDAAAQVGRGGGAQRAGGGTTGATAGAGAAAAGGQETGAFPAGAGSGAGGLGNLDFLRNNPQFQQLRQVVQQQPHMLEPILQQVGAGNPQLAQLIGHHPEQFLQLLSEDDEDPTPPMNITEEEREAIDRLMLLGFDREIVIQAYFACDKNEELAANFLFDQPPDDTPES
ncbi:MAG: hypothetical protein M1825_004431 [Sarcosagium campestre]|nr:MAG: hypothetical protein M1825_004431 [Sarcosagium campestre]